MCVCVYVNVCVCACGCVCVSHSEQQAEELVSALVFSFLIPEVQRISVRQKGPDSNPPLLTQHTGSPRGLSLGPDQ